MGKMQFPYYVQLSSGSCSLEQKTWQTVHGFVFLYVPRSTGAMHTDTALHTPPTPCYHPLVADG